MIGPRVAALTAVALALACTEPAAATVVPSGAYVLSACIGVGSAPTAPPCANGRNSKWIDYIDSGRVSFANGRAAFMLWQRTDYFYAYVPGDTTPWTTHSAMAVDTTFEVTGDSVRLGSAGIVAVMSWQPPSELRWQASQFTGSFTKKP